MLGIPSRNCHFVFGTIQAGLTSLIAAGIKDSIALPAAGREGSLYVRFTGAI